MADVEIVDDAIDPKALSTLREAIASSRLLGDSPLGGTFLATRGFSITFHRDARGDVEKRFPFFSPFLALALDAARVRAVQPKPLLGGPPAPSAFYMNVLAVPPGAAVGRHVDATLGPPNGSVVPAAVAVLYVDVPEDMTGGELVLVDGDREIHALAPKTNRFVLFAGRLGHEVRAVSASRARVSVVCEEYALSPGVLSAVPRLKVHSRAAFAAVLDDVRARSR